MFYSSCTTENSRGCKNFTKKIVTNADRIRAMSDEELAAILAAFCESSECRAENGAVCPFYQDCPQDSNLPRGWIDWFRQPAEGEQHEV